MPAIHQVYAIASLWLAAAGAVQAAVTPDELLLVEDEQERYRLALALDGDALTNIPRTAISPEIDGNLDDAVWQEAAQIELDWQLGPVSNVPAKERTTAYLIEDGRTLYVAFDAKDSAPENIRAHLRKRDAIFNDDYVGLGIDTTGDAQRGFQFFSNPIGAQADAVIDRRNHEDFSFNAIFVTGGKVNADGYVVEMAIPLTELRFPRTKGDQAWRIVFYRTFWRDERYHVRSAPRDRNNDCGMCDFERFTGLPDVRPGGRFHIVPGLTANVAETRDALRTLPDDRDTDLSASIEDFRYSITPDLSFNATVNPDFSHIEADIAQSSVNESFVLFFPERRAFFLEGRDLFQSDLRLVNTRNIADPRFGAKLSGKVGQNAYGLLTARDRVTNFLISGFESSSTTQIDEPNTSSALRYRRDFAEGSFIGGMITSRDGSDYENQVASVDGVYRFGPSDTLSVQAAKSWSENPQVLIDDFGLSAEPTDEAYQIAYRHNGQKWFGRLNHQRVGAEFSADLGFINQRNFAQTGGNVGHYWRGQPGDFVSHLNAGVQYFYTTLEEDNSVLWRGGGVFMNMAIPRDTWISASYFHQQRQFSGRWFDLGNFNAQFRSRPAQGFSYFFRMDAGDAIDVVNVRDADRLWIRQRVEYNVNEHLLLRLRHTYLHLDVSGGRLLTSHLSDFRATYQFDLRNALTTSVIYRNTEYHPERYMTDQIRRSEAYDVQLLYSYELNPQTVVFAGYSSSGFGDDQFSGVRDTFQSVFLKMTYALKR